jgi:hypothetical protein
MEIPGSTGGPYEIGADRRNALKLYLLVIIATGNY